jgi:hypothetical protein
MTKKSRELDQTVVAAFQIMRELNQRQFEFAMMLLNRAAHSRPSEPPRIAEFLLILCSKSSGDALIGDINERYAREYVEYGPERARRRYWAEAARSFVPLLWRALCRALKTAAVIDALWRYFSR